MGLDKGSLPGAYGWPLVATTPTWKPGFESPHEVGLVVTNELFVVFCTSTEAVTNVVAAACPGTGDKLFRHSF